MTEEQAKISFNAIKSLELAKIRRELNWLKWILVVAMLAGSVSVTL